MALSEHRLPIPTDLFLQGPHSMAMSISGTWYTTFHGIQMYLVLPNPWSSSMETTQTIHKSWCSLSCKPSTPRRGQNSREALAQPTCQGAPLDGPMALCYGKFKHHLKDSTTGPRGYVFLGNNLNQSRLFSSKILCSFHMFKICSSHILILQ